MAERCPDRRIGVMSWQSADPCPEPVPAPEGRSLHDLHLSMVGAVISGGGLERLADMAHADLLAPGAVVVPPLGGVVAGRWGSWCRGVARWWGAMRVSCRGCAPTCEIAWRSAPRRCPSRWSPRCR